MLFVSNLTKSVQVVDDTLIAPMSVGELKHIKTKEEFVNTYGEDILLSLSPVGEIEGRKKVKEQKQTIKEADKKIKEKEQEREQGDDEMFS